LPALDLPFPPLTSLAAVLLAAPFVRADDPVAEFGRYYKKYDDTPTRIEAILGLQGKESPRVVDALLIVFKDDDPTMLEQATTALHQSLEVHPWISDAILFDRDDKVFTRYTRDEPLAPPPIPDEDVAYIDKKEVYAHAFVSLYFIDDGESQDVGTIYLRGT